jgi:hypothetical protein
MIKTQQGNVPPVEEKSRYRGRAKINHEQMPLRFPEGTLARLDAVLKENETRTDLLRECVESVIVSRERILTRQRIAAEAEAERQRIADEEERAAAAKKAAAKAKRDAKKAQKRAMSEAAE